MAGTRFKPVPVLVIKNNGKLGFVQIPPVRVHVPTRVFIQGIGLMYAFEVIVVREDWCSNQCRNGVCNH